MSLKYVLVLFFCLQVYAKPSVEKRSILYEVRWFRYRKRGTYYGDEPLASATVAFIYQQIIYYMRFKWLCTDTDIL